MRFVTALLARQQGQEPVPFKPMTSLKLRQHVSGKGDRSTDVCCIHEMSIMFACFKKNEFSQQICSKEIDSFQKCFTTTLDTRRETKEREAKGVLNPGEKRMSAKQLNLLLNQFPNVK